MPEFIWGTYGKGVIEKYESGKIKKLPKVKWKPLKKCTTNHLIRILVREAWHLPDEYINEIKRILMRRTA